VKILLKIANTAVEEYEPAKCRAFRTTHYFEQIFHSIEERVSALLEAVARRTAPSP
jgi:hypothetical protein